MNLAAQDVPERPAAPLPDAAPKPLLDAPQSRAASLTMWTFVVVPQLCLLAAIPFAWGWGLSPLDIALAGSGFAAVVAGMIKGRDWLVAALVLVAAALQGFIHGMAASSMGQSAGFIAGLTVATLAIAGCAAIVSRRFKVRALA